MNETIHVPHKEVGYVTDTLAVNAKRYHQIPTAFDSNRKPVSFKQYELSANEETEMPLDHALFFLGSESFIVKDGTKKVLKPLASQEQATHVTIPDNFVLAEYSELTRDALVARCKVLPGSEHIHVKKTSVDELISFLKSSRPAVSKTAEPFDAINQKALDRMLGE